MRYYTIVKARMFLVHSDSCVFKSEQYNNIISGGKIMTSKNLVTVSLSVCGLAVPQKCLKI